MAVRRNRDENRRSGLSGMGKRYRFEGREAPEPWQAEAWAEDHAANGRGRLVCSEGMGTGKSRRCSAECVRLREEGRDVRYALRQESVSRAGVLVNGAGEHEALLRPRKTVDGKPAHGLSEAGKGQQPD